LLRAALPGCVDCVGVTDGVSDAAELVAGAVVPALPELAVVLDAADVTLEDAAPDCEVDALRAIDATPGPRAPLGVAS
jgi:hypothetical protein